MPVFDTAHDVEVLIDGGVTSMTERLVIAPCAGRFVPLPPQTFTAEGEWIAAGETIAEIHVGKDVIPAVSAFSGWVMGMLAVPGQPVNENDALFRIRP
jgi:biotin carboxyl carrier protein